MKIGSRINDATVQLLLMGNVENYFLCGYSGSSGIATSYHIATLVYCYQNQHKSQARGEEKD